MWFRNLIGLLLISGFAYGQNPVQTKKLILQETSGSNFSAFQIGSQSSDFTYTWPAAGPTNGYLLQTNGSGTMIWVSPSSLTGLPYWPLTGLGNLTGSVQIDGGGIRNLVFDDIAGFFIDAAGLTLGSTGDADINVEDQLLIEANDVNFSLDAGDGSYQVASSAGEYGTAIMSSGTTGSPSRISLFTGAGSFLEFDDNVAGIIFGYNGDSRNVTINNTDNISTPTNGYEIKIDQDEFTVTDENSSKTGIRYAATGYVTNARSLTDKGYVDAFLQAIALPAAGTAGQSLRRNAGNTAWENYTPSAGGSGTVESITLTQPAAGLTITGSGTPITTTGTPTFALANDLAALEGMSGTGIVVRTTSETYAQRTLTEGTGIDITNGDGVSGNPTIAIESSYLVHTLSGTLSSGTILGLGSTTGTGLTLLAAQGANTFIYVTSIIWLYDHNTTSFDGTLAVGYDTGSAMDPGPLSVNSGFVGVNADNIMHIATDETDGTAAAAVLNKPLVFYAPVDFTTGDGSVKYFIKYQVLTF